MMMIHTRTNIAKQLHTYQMRKQAKLSFQWHQDQIQYKGILQTIGEVGSANEKQKKKKENMGECRLDQ